MERADLRQAAATVRAHKNRALTWHNLAQLIAQLVMLAFGSLWLRVWWFRIEPSIVVWNAEGVFHGALDGLLAVVLAAACATVPAIFWSGIIPNSPANTLLNELHARYGRPGYVFAAVGATLFTVLGLFVLQDYWLSRPNVVAAGAVQFWLTTAVTLFLMVGFPAWALNKMTPEQWVDAVLLAREVARIQRIIALEEMAEKAIIARARALLHADVTQLTLEQRAVNNREVAAILAAAERGIHQSLTQVASSINALHHMEVITTQHDQAIVDRYAYVAQTLQRAADTTERRATYAQLLAEDEEQSTLPSPAPFSHPDAETGDRADDDDRAPVGHGGTAAAQGASAGDDALALARAVLGAGAWSRAQLQEALNVEKTKALDLIARWLQAGQVTKLTEPRNHYTFQEVR